MPGMSHPASNHAARDRRRAEAKAEAQAQGFGNVSARTKALKRNCWKADQRNCVDQQIAAEIQTPRFDRLAGQDGPVKILMKEGKWLAC